MEIKIGLKPETKHVHSINIVAKCSDRFGAFLKGYDGVRVGDMYDGYVPDFFPGDHFGDYVMLDIELETGKILNWKKPTEQDLEIFSKDI